MKKFGLFVLLSSLFIYGCETDFEVNAPYKEVMVIDGLLNANDAEQSIRISKAFLGEGDAYIMAQQDDSINYGDVLDVQMQRILNKSVMQTFTLTRSEHTDKDTGIFASKYVLYKTNQKIFQDGSEYKIIVTNRQTGVTATSQTEIVDSLIEGPIPTGDSIDFATNPNSPYIIRFVPGENSYYYEMIIRFNYREINPATGLSTLLKVDWYFASPTALTSSEAIFSFYKNNLFINLGANIPDKPGYIRRIDSLLPGQRPFDILLMEGSEDLNTYIELQKPATGVVQERPLFTTVENGLGLFTSRYIKTISRFPKQTTINAFDTSAALMNKNFQFD
jgi:Domain of unknown function (DUF4249)